MVNGVAAPSMSLRCCGSCEHFHPNPGQLQIGMCQKEPPRPVVMRYDQMQLVGPKGEVVNALLARAVDGYFAPTNAKLVCGAFMPKLPASMSIADHAAGVISGFGVPDGSDGDIAPEADQG